MTNTQMGVGGTVIEHSLGVDTGERAEAERLAGDPSGAIGRKEPSSSTMSSMKVLKPLAHAVIDYTWAGTMIAAPWLFGFSRNKKATMHAVGSGIGVIGLGLFTKYPLGVVKAIPFPIHGVVEATVAGVLTATAPWLMGFSRDRNAKLTHVLSGLSTLAVVAMTDYRAAERQERANGEPPQACNKKSARALGILFRHGKIN